jgi:hypothetical protein
MRHGPDGAEIAFSAEMHAPEFDNRETTSPKAHASLPVEDGAAVGHPDCQRNGGKQRRERNERHHGDRDIGRSFYKARNA